MKTLSEFSNPSLQKIHSESKSIIADHIRELDQVSNDIKVMEELLKSYAVPFRFCYVISSSIEEIGMLRRYTENCLVWGKSKEGLSRLTHEVYVIDEDVEELYTDHGCHYRIEPRTPVLTSSTPLIEKTAHFRLSIKNSLVSFYEKIIFSIKEKKCEDVVVDYSDESLLIKRQGMTVRHCRDRVYL